MIRFCHLAGRGIFRGVRKAVIDIGSNSVLLLIEDNSSGAWVPVRETTNVSSLGEGTKETGLLSPKGIERTLEALRDAFEEARGAGCDEVIAGATMAVRIAKNRGEFMDRALEQGTPVQVVSGDQEAELGFRSVANDPVFGAHPRLSIIDVGGQSTELVTADREDGTWNIRFRRSFPVGTLGLRGSVLATESPGFKEMLAAVCAIDDVVGMCYLPNQGGHCVALGATGTNLVTIREGMSEWDPARVHGAWLDYEEVSKAAGWLSAMTDAQRREVRGMEPGREKTLHIGALILERFLYATRSLGCSVSVRGWRHALLEEGLPDESTR